MLFSEREQTRIPWGTLKMKEVKLGKVGGVGSIIGIANVGRGEGCNFGQLLSVFKGVFCVMIYVVPW